MGFNVPLSQDINVLGTVYTLKFVPNDNDYPLLSGANGYMDPTVREIVIRTDFSDDEDIQNPEFIIKKNIRHEVIHAFLYESGLDCNSNKVTSWATNEEMVDWFALQFPKIIEVLKSISPGVL